MRRYIWRMTSTTGNIFLQMLATDVGKHVEKKGKFSYLSWSYAVAELRKADPLATWEVTKWPLPDAAHVLAPYCQTPAGCFVEVAVTVQGVRLAQVHPVIDERNGTIKNPDAGAINKSIMRCLVKAIALHGLGLHIYAGEDLPLGDAEPAEKPTKKAAPVFAMGPVLDMARIICEGDDKVLLWVTSEGRIDAVTDDGPMGQKMARALGSLLEKRAAKLADAEWAPADGTPAAKEAHAKKVAGAKYLETELEKVKS